MEKKRGISGIRERIRTQLAEWRRLSSREVGAPKGGTPFYLTAQEPALTQVFTQGLAINGVSLDVDGVDDSGGGREFNLRCAKQASR